MILSFVPRRGCMPKWPGKGRGTYPYVGRTFDAQSRVNRANSEPTKVVTHKEGKLTPECERLAYDLCRRDGDLLPTDESTAKFCGVAFRQVKQADDGEWDLATASKKGGE